MPEPLVFDSAGNPRDLAWLRAKYGPFVIHKPRPLPEGYTALEWQVTALREKLNAPAALVVQTRNTQHDLQPSVKVAWYWPDADADPEAGPLGAPYEGVTPGRAVHGFTNVNGDTGFAMGNGAYYWADRGERGPHATWIHGAETRSQLLLGLGMLAGTNHFHFDVEFSLVPVTGGEEGEEATEFLILLEEMLEQLTRIADALEAANDAMNAAEETLRATHDG